VGDRHRVIPVRATHGVRRLGQTHHEKLTIDLRSSGHRVGDHGFPKESRTTDRFIDITADEAGVTTRGARMRRWLTGPPGWVLSLMMCAAAVFTLGVFAAQIEHGGAATNWRAPAKCQGPSTGEPGGAVLWLIQAGRAC
jgi:hypothetical protein